MIGSKRSTRASRRRARDNARCKRSPWPYNAPRWAARRQSLIDQLGVEAFTRQRGTKAPLWIDMPEAGERLGCSAAAARKRLQRGGAQLLRVGGRLLVRRITIAVKQPNFGMTGQPARRITTSEVAKTLRGRGGRLLSVQGARKWLQRHDLVHKEGGRWVANDLLSVRVEVEREKLGK